MIDELLENTPKKNQRSLTDRKTRPGIFVDLTHGQLESFKEYCKSKDVSMGALVRTFVQKCLEEKGSN